MKSRDIADMTGQRFGRLVVAGDPQRGGPGKPIKWRCVCDCGGEAYVNGSRLRRGKSQSCGCLARELSSQRMKVARPEPAHYKQYTPGMKFGKLTLVERMGLDESRRSSWRAVCECGAEVVTTTRKLRENVKVCSCHKVPKVPKALRPVKPRKPQPVVGSVYGLLTVTADAGVDELRHRWWECACECGGTKRVRTGSLIAGHARSCGCLKIGRKAQEPKPPKVKKPKVTRERVKAPRESSSIGAWPKTAAKVAKAPAKADSRPAWRAHSEYAPLSQPAQRAAAATICPAPKFNHRYGVDPSEVAPLFSAMRPGQYLEVAA